MITIRYLGNGMSQHHRYEVIRDGMVVGGVFLPWRSRHPGPLISRDDLGAGFRCLEAAIRGFRFM